MPFGRAVAGSVALSIAALALTTPVHAQSQTRQQAYSAAAARYGVPADVLLAVSYVESRWDTNAGTPSTGGGYGPMHLTDAAEVTTLRKPTLRKPTSLSLPSWSAQTVDRAAALTGMSKQELRTDPSANIAGGAALLRSYQDSLGAPTGTSSDITAWYAAVARYSGAGAADTAEVFADEVYATIRAGATRTTDDGHSLTLTPHPGLGPRAPECPGGLSCEWIPAPYQDLGDGAYGNHDLSERPARQQIEYIVIHDTESTYPSVIDMVQDPAYVSWNYTIRSADGHLAQHVKAKDVAWHAGNWYVNAKSIGIEHEGFAAEGTWYTETMYRSSAKLVRYLAQRYGIPLDRQHIIGHDNVPGITPDRVADMHWDPGPYWDWAHYFKLLQAPLRPTGTPRSGLVTIDPDFATNRPAFTGCTEPHAEPCPSRGSSAVILRTAPRLEAPLVTDLGLHPDGSPSTMDIADHGARASTGQVYAVAGRQGDWTAIWYLGQRAWFYNPASAPTALWTSGRVATPRAGLAAIPVYGRAYPEAGAYPAGVPVQELVPLQYTLAAGQRYSAGAVVRSEYYRSVTYDGSSPSDWTVIRGAAKYVQLQFGHRVAFVNLDDVEILAS